VLAVSNVLSAYLCDPSAALRFIGIRLSLPQRRGEPQRYAEKTFEAKRCSTGFPVSPVCITQMRLHLLEKRRSTISIPVSNRPSAIMLDC
jgi:hypothetical protein